MVGLLEVEGMEEEGEKERGWRGDRIGRGVMGERREMEEVG